MPYKDKEKHLLNVRKYYWKNRDKELNRGKVWRQKNRNKRTAYFRSYRQTLNGKEATLKAIKKYEGKHPERKKAWIEAVKLIKKPCIKCGVLPSHKHHPDPLKPLEVIYLCPLHHKQQHLL